MNQQKNTTDLGAGLWKTLIVGPDGDQPSYLHIRSWMWKPEKKLKWLQVWRHNPHWAWCTCDARRPAWFILYNSCKRRSYHWIGLRMRALLLDLGQRWLISLINVIWCTYQTRDCCSTEMTAGSSLPHLRDQLRVLRDKESLRARPRSTIDSSSEGQRILRERPRVNSSTIDIHFRKCCHLFIQVAHHLRGPRGRCSTVVIRCDCTLKAFQTQIGRQSGPQTKPSTVY
jgi:hypothetical protein